MSSREEVSYPILLKHDVDYVLVIFGGLLGYSGDDINKVPPFFGILVNNSFSGWSVLPKESGRTKSKKKISSLHQDNIALTTRRPRQCETPLCIRCLITGKFFSLGSVKLISDIINCFLQGRQLIGFVELHCLLKDRNWIRWKRLLLQKVGS